jgi:outer membrane protein OmpA-like peptidoglycan-associated protein
MLGLQGCVATRGWVSEQITPLGERVSQVEAQQSQTDGRLGKAEMRAEEILGSMGRLRLERQLVLDVQGGAHFAFDSATLTPEAKRLIDQFLRDLDMTDNMRLLVIGHTDNSGAEDYNYELGQKRAASVARYLISQKGVEPLQVTAVSYGASLPIADNATREGRLQNRRTEILVYNEAIRAAPARQRLDLQRTSKMNRDPSRHRND